MHLPCDVVPILFERLMSSLRIDKKTLRGLALEGFSISDLGTNSNHQSGINQVGIVNVIPLFQLPDRYMKTPSNAGQIIAVLDAIPAADYRLWRRWRRVVAVWLVLTWRVRVIAIRRI